MYLVTDGNTCSDGFQILENAMKHAHDCCSKARVTTVYFVVETLHRYEQKKTLVITDLKAKQYMTEQFPS